MRQIRKCANKAGGVAREPVIGETVDALLAQRGARALSAEEFEQHFGALPADAEG